MPRLISSLCRSVRSPVSRSVRVDFPWSTCPTTPMLTSGWPGTFIAPAPARRRRSTSAALDDLQVQLQDVRRHRVPADRLLLPDPRARRMEPDAPADQEALPPRPRQVGPHREAVLVAPSGDLELVAGQADVQAVEVVAELLADQGVGVVPGDVPLVRLAVLGICDDRFEFRQRAPTEGIRPCGASIKDFRHVLVDVSSSEIREEAEDPTALPI